MKRYLRLFIWTRIQVANEDRSQWEWVRNIEEHNIENIRNRFKANGYCTCVEKKIQYDSMEGWFESNKGTGPSHTRSESPIDEELIVYRASV